MPANANAGAGRRWVNPSWPVDDGSGALGSSRVDRIVRSHGDGEHYADLPVVATLCTCLFCERIPPAS